MIPVSFQITVIDHLKYITEVNTSVSLTGDYITIYQFQRGVMKQQARERELELSSLRHEREEMKIKLSTLQVSYSKGCGSSISSSSCCSSCRSNHSGRHSRVKKGMGLEI